MYYKFFLKKLIFSFFLSIGILLSAQLFAQAPKDTLFVNSSSEYPIYKHLYIYQTQNYQSPQFLYDSVARNNFSLLYPSKSFNNITSPTAYCWLLVTVKNNLPKDDFFYYWLNNPGVDRVSAYCKKNENGEFHAEGQSGYYVLPSRRQTRSYDAEFKFMIKSGETVTILLCVENIDGTNLFFVPQLAEESVFMTQYDRYIKIMSIIAGILLLTAILNIFFALSLKENIHYLYAAYIVCVFFEIFTLEGIATSYLQNYLNAEFIDLLAHISPCVCMLLMTYIMQWVMVQKSGNSHLRFFVNAVTYFIIAITVIYIFQYVFSFAYINKNLLQRILVLLVILQLLLIICSGMERALQGSKIALVYLLATSWLIFGFIENALIYLEINTIESAKGLSPSNLEIGIVFEVLVVFLAIIYRYNSYKKEKEHLLKAAAMQQQNLINRIVYAEEEERKRIAIDLHDDVASTLSTLSLHISNIPDDIRNRKDIETYYKKGLALSNKAVNDIRDIAHNLLPKDFTSIGFFNILKNRIDELNILKKIHFNLLVEGSEQKLSDDLSIIIYRIINELLTNILKHSVASEASVQILVDDKNVQIMVEDDGIGFDVNLINKGIGLNSITGRIEFLKGSIQIDSSNNGTNTIINLPL